MPAPRKVVSAPDFDQGEHIKQEFGTQDLLKVTIEANRESGEVRDEVDYTVTYENGYQHPLSTVIVALALPDGASGLTNESDEEEPR